MSTKKNPFPNHENTAISRIKRVYRQFYNCVELGTVKKSASTYILQRELNTLAELLGLSESERKAIQSEFDLE